MSISSVIILLAGGTLTLAYALWDFGADHIVAMFGRSVVRVVTFGRVCLRPDADDSTAIGVAAFTVAVLFLVLLLVAAILE